MPRKSLFPLACAVLLSAVMPLAAQTAPTTPAAPAPAGQVSPTATGAQDKLAHACAEASAMAEPATKDNGTSDGTAPSNSGSTGWSGGTGGSNIGTNPSGATKHTKTWHAPTARGLDLTGRPDPAPTC